MLAPTAPVGRLRGVGPKLARELARHGIEVVADLVWLLPIGWDDLERTTPLTSVSGRAGERVVVRGSVRSSGLAFVRGRRATRVVLGDENGNELSLWWFFAAHGIVALARSGRELVAIGKVSASGKTLAHPELLDPEHTPRIRPRYPRSGAPSERIRALVSSAIAELGSIPEVVPATVARREGFASLGELLPRLHAPSEPPSIEEIRGTREVLAWGEAATRVLARRLREQSGTERALVAPPAPEAVLRLASELGISWTAGQARAIAEIESDLARAEPMRRLLSGDVGSGKTAVALAAIAQVVSAGHRAAVLAPTLVLADQYRSALESLERALGVRTAMLTARARAADRRALMSEIEAGKVAVLVGTHALLSDALTLPALALAVVDEQQRFGVAQRLAFGNKAEHAVHTLSLSATPIPRTLAAVLRGDVAESELGELPPGRLPIATELVPRSAFDSRVLPAIEGAEACFVVCPTIEDDADSDVPAATQRYAELVARLGSERVVLAHGRSKPAQLRDALDRFRSGAATVLVGTTVVEVGIDVPRATLMVIDGAEHFGLAQLHQLRGRVGRSTRPSRCLLVHDEPLGPLARARLQALVELRDGAEIARRDLELRGAGDAHGTRQSGESALGHLESFAEAPWLGRIEADVDALLKSDPRLEAHPGLALFALRASSRWLLAEEAA